MQNFCVVDLSNFYLDSAKDRLYISHSGALRRRQCQTVLALIVENLAKAIAPVLSHMAEDIWQALPYTVPQVSVFAAGWLVTPDQWQQPELAQTWEWLRKVRLEVNKALETARTEKLIGASTDAQITVTVAEPELLSALRDREPELRYLFLASRVHLVSGGAGLEVQVAKAAGHKCSRCWNYSEQVGSFAEHPELCERCVGALAGEF